MLIGEMFCGIGGFRFGLEKANQSDSTAWRERMGNCEGRRNADFERSGGRTQQTYDCVWANDWDKYACQIYRKHYGNSELVEADITKIQADDIPDFDLLTAGFPCQSFSLAGKRKGFQDIRGTMFFQVARIAEAKKPKLLLLENVKGLLSNDNGKTFGTILEELGRIGYWCEWQTLNSKHFGVPQNRERVFIVGHLRGESTKQIFPVGSDGEAVAENGAVARTLQGGGHSGGLHSRMTAIKEESETSVLLQKHRKDDFRFYPEFAPSLQSRDYKEPNLVLQQHSHSGEDGKGRGIRVFEGEVPTLTQQMGTGGNNVPMIANTLDVDGYLRTGARPRDENGKPQLLPIGYRRIRRLTPTECERLQGFPDGWTEGVSDTQRYKLLGNAVTTNVIEFLGEKLLEALA